MSKGVIITGYQGIGKSSLANRESGYIDLESGNFWVNGKRAEDWYIPYCNIALHLAEQGYRVFVSSHAVVTSYLSSIPRTVDLYACYPSFSLREQWVSKLKRRYDDSRLEKDFKAWRNAEEKYNENIGAMYRLNGFTQIVIHDMGYSLRRCIEDAIELKGAQE